jgi:hypothetical protein
VSQVSESAEVAASLAEVWGLYFEPKSWSGWVDGFRTVEASDGYPQAGGTLRWRSTPAGRGVVTERVIEHEPRTRHRIAFKDEYSEGELTTTFAIEGERVKVTQACEYTLHASGAFGPLTDRFFVRPQIRRSLQRSLGRLKLDAEELASLSP